MPLALPAPFEDAIAETVTAPVMLCELHLPLGNDYYLTSFDDSIFVDDRTWVDENLVVSGPTQKSGGTLTATVSVPYDTLSSAGNQIAGVVATARPQDSRARIGMTYWHNDAFVPPLLTLDGLIDDVVISTAGAGKPRVSLTIVSLGNRGGVTPYIRLAPPLLHYITPAGSMIEWNGGRYQIGKN